MLRILEHLRQILGLAGWLAGALDVPPAELCAGVDWSVERQRYE